MQRRVILSIRSNSFYNRHESLFSQFLILIKLFLSGKFITRYTNSSIINRTTHSLKNFPTNGTPPPNYSPFNTDPLPLSSHHNTL